MTILAHFRSHSHKPGLKLGFKTYTFTTSGPSFGRPVSPCTWASLAIGPEAKWSSGLNSLYYVLTESTYFIYCIYTWFFKVYLCLG